MAPTAATHCNTLQHTATHCNTLQHTATHCNTLQHTATHCYSGEASPAGVALPLQLCGGALYTYLLERTRVVSVSENERNYHFFYQLIASANSGSVRGHSCVAVCCSVLQCVLQCQSTHLFFFQLIACATSGSVRGYSCVAVCCSVLQCVAVDCGILGLCCRVLQCFVECCNVLQCVGQSPTRAHTLARTHTHTHTHAHAHSPSRT